MNNTILQEGEFKITKDQILQLTDPKVKEWFPEAFKNKLEVGKWYKSGNLGRKKMIVRVVSFQGDEFTGYGIDWDGEFLFESGWRLNNPIEASEKEVFEALKNQAIKRGFEKKCFFKAMDDSSVIESDGNFELVPENEKWHFEGVPVLQVSSVDIFRNGKWAKTVQVMSKQEAEKLLNKIILD